MSRLITLIVILLGQFIVERFAIAGNIAFPAGVLCGSTVLAVSLFLDKRIAIRKMSRDDAEIGRSDE